VHWCGPWAHSGATTSNGFPRRGSPSTRQYPDSHNHFAIPWSDSPNRYRLPSWPFAVPPDELQSILSHWAGIRIRPQMEPYSHFKKTHNPTAFAKCTKPPSARTHGELRPEMITYNYFFLIFQLFCPRRNVEKYSR